VKNCERGRGGEEERRRGSSRWQEEGW